MTESGKVTPCAGVWIEIGNRIDFTDVDMVTPCAGVWIEIFFVCHSSETYDVTPCAGVWIEICFDLSQLDMAQSLPVRECGLKYRSS